MHVGTDNAADQRIRIPSVQTDRDTQSRPAGDGPPDPAVRPQAGISKGKTVDLAGRSKPRSGAAQTHAARTGTRKLAVAAGVGARRSRAVSAGEREKLGGIPPNSGMVTTVCPVSTLDGSVAILHLDAGMNDVQQVEYHNEGGVTSDGNQTQSVLQFSF